MMIILRKYSSKVVGELVNHPVLYMKHLDSLNDVSNTSISSNEISKYIKSCIDQRNDAMLGKLFEKYILYTGPDELIKKPIIELNNGQLFNMIKFFKLMNNVKMYSKCVAYYTTRISKDKNKLMEIHENSFRDKIDIYINKLGPYEIIKNGMFTKFQIYKLQLNNDDTLINALSIYFNENKIILNLKICKELYLMMHGINTKPYKEEYSKTLNPDIQMARIYRSTIKKTEIPDPLIIEKYNEIINNSGKKTHLRQKLDHNQQKHSSHVPFHCYPFTLILKLLLKVEFTPEVPVKLLQFIVMECGIKPDKPSLSLMGQVLRKTGNDSMADMLDNLYKA